MNFDNWCYHLNKINDFYNSDFFEICCNDDNIVTNLFYGYITAIGEDLVCDQVAQIYYGEDSCFWIDYLIEDFLKYKQAIIPNFKDTFNPLPLTPDIAAELDYQHGIPLDTEEELYKFITTGEIPKKDSIYIPMTYAIRRNSN